MIRQYTAPTKKQCEFFMELTNISKINIYKSLREQDIKPSKLYKIIRSDDVLNRRDEFYALFKTESLADKWWTRVTDWKLENDDRIYPLHYEYPEEVDEEC